MSPKGTDLKGTNPKIVHRLPDLTVNSAAMIDLTDAIRQSSPHDPVASGKHDILDARKSPLPRKENRDTIPPDVANNVLWKEAIHQD